MHRGTALEGFFFSHLALCLNSRCFSLEGGFLGLSLRPVPVFLGNPLIRSRPSAVKRAHQFVSDRAAEIMKRRIHSRRQSLF